MAGARLIEYAEADPEVRAVFDDIKQTRNIPDVNNFWKVIANHPPTLKERRVFYSSRINCLKWPPAALIFS